MHSRSTGILISLLALAAGCGGGGGGGSDNSASQLLRGTVRSPGGQAIDLVVGQKRIQRADNSSIELPGYLPVPDFTEVELVRVDPAGNTLAIIARGATVAGRYSFDLDTLNQSFSNQLMVRAGSGAARMRALAIGPETDIDPLNEAVVQLFVQEAGRLDRLTIKEVDDFRATVEFLALTERFQSQGDVESTVAFIYQEVLAQPAIMNFLALAAGAGQTSEGPGDFADFFPHAKGNTWVMQGARTIDGGIPTPFNSARRILEQAGPEFTIALSNPPESRTPLFEFVDETSTSISKRGTTDPDDPLQIFAPVEELRFPIRIQEKRILFEGDNVPAGDDFDQDGIEDGMDIVAEQTALGLETIVTTLDTFHGCLRLQRSLETTLRLSGGGSGSSTSLLTRWFAPGLGLVHQEGTSRLTLDGVETEETFGQTLLSFAVGTATRGILPPLPLIDTATPEVDPERPGRTAVGFDGTNHFVITCRELEGTTQLVGTIVGPKGMPLLEVPILTVALPECRLQPAIAFGGAYLITYVEGNGSTGRIRGVRVTRAGVVLDPLGFDISMGTTDTQPAVAFDNNRFMVLWRRLDARDEGDLHAAFVVPNGSSALEFVVHAGPGDQSQPALDFGGGNYFAVWSDTVDSTPEIHGSLIDPAGRLFGEGDFLVSSQSSAGGDLQPQLAHDETLFLITWLRATRPGGDLHHVYATSMDFDGLGLEDDPIAVHLLDLPNNSLSLDYDGQHFALTWATATDDDNAGIHLARVSATGLLLDGSPMATARSLARPPARAHLTHPVIRGARLSGDVGALTVWTLAPEGAGKTQTIEGLRAYSF